MVIQGTTGGAVKKGKNHMIEEDDCVLVTGASGFIGSRVVRVLLAKGFRRVRCLTRRAVDPGLLQLREEYPSADIEIVRGNLLSRELCTSLVRGSAVIYHLAAGVDKTFPACVQNSAVTTRNLLDAMVSEGKVRRFVNTSSLAVYSTALMRRGALLDEACPIDEELAERYDAYAYGKAMQDELVVTYGRTKGLPYVIVRPGVTFGPGKVKIPGRVGIDTFGIFLHLGLNNRMPLTYVDNCAEAVVLAGLVPGIEGEVINIIDDDLPRSRDFLRTYKRHVRRFTSVPVPYRLFYLFNRAWEKYSTWSEGQLPPAFNRRTCEAYFKGNTYSNSKAKRLLGWTPRVRMDDAMIRYCEYARQSVPQAK